jgi:hypothetical protein
VENCVAAPSKVIPGVYNQVAWVGENLLKGRERLDEAVITLQQ